MDRAKPVCGRLNVGCAWSGPGGYGPPCPWYVPLSLVWSCFPGVWSMCLILVRVKALSLYKGEAIVRVYGACAWYNSLFHMKHGMAVLGL